MIYVCTYSVCVYNLHRIKCVYRRKEPFFQILQKKMCSSSTPSSTGSNAGERNKGKKNVRHQTSLASYMLLTDVEHLYNWVVVEPPL